MADREDRARRGDDPLAQRRCRTGTPGRDLRPDRGQHVQADPRGGGWTRRTVRPATGGAGRDGWR